MYCDFVTFFVAPVVGKKRFESLCWRENFSTFVTTSDEALALLLFENNYDRWIDMGKNNQWKSSCVCPKYTTGGNASQTPKNGNDAIDGSSLKGSTCAKYQGWSVEGIRKYNTYFDEIKAERESSLGQTFEEALLKYSIDYREKLSDKPRKEVVEYVTYKHELWNVKVMLEKIYCQGSYEFIYQHLHFVWQQQ